MSRDVVGELRGLYEAGTKGEWFAVGDGRMEIVADADTQPDCERAGTCVLLNPTMSLGRRQAEADAALIVAMHRHLPALLAVVEAAKTISLLLESHGVPLPERCASALDDLDDTLSALTTDEGGTL